MLINIQAQSWGFDIPSMRRELRAQEHMGCFVPVDAEGSDFVLRAEALAASLRMAQLHHWNVGNVPGVIPKETASLIKRSGVEGRGDFNRLAFIRRWDIQDDLPEWRCGNSAVSGIRTFTVSRGWPCCGHGPGCLVWAQLLPSTPTTVWLLSPCLAFIL